jgi:hypothetical protein
VYALHLYGDGFSRSGAFLLGLTFLWFATALYLFRTRRRLGFWVLLAYATVQLLFYLDGEVILAFAGYGLPYHLARTQDAVVWLTLLVGDLNFVAAAGVVFWLVRGRKQLDRAPAGSPASRR